MLRSRILLFAMLMMASKCLLAQAADSARHAEGKRLALTWLDGMMRGRNVDSLLSISAVPFQFDGKEVLGRRWRLRRRYEAIFSDKGCDRGYAVDTIRIYERPESRGFKPWEYSFVVRISLADKEGIDVFVVDTGDGLKVAGMRD